MFLTISPLKSRFPLAVVTMIRVTIVEEPRVPTWVQEGGVQEQRGWWWTLGVRGVIFVGAVGLGFVESEGKKEGRKLIYWPSKKHSLKSPVSA